MNWKEGRQNRLVPLGAEGVLAINEFDVAHWLSRARCVSSRYRDDLDEQEIGLYFTAAFGPDTHMVLNTNIVKPRGMSILVAISD